MLSVWTCLLLFFTQASFSLNATNVVIYTVDKNIFSCAREAARVVTIVPTYTCIQGFNGSYSVTFSDDDHILVQTYSRSNFQCFKETPPSPLYSYKPGVCGLGGRKVDLYDGTLASAPGPSDSIQELYLFPNCGTSTYQGTVIQYAAACAAQTALPHNLCQAYNNSQSQPFQQFYKFTCGGGSARYRAPNEAPSTVLVYYSFEVVREKLNESGPEKAVWCVGQDLSASFSIFSLALTTFVNYHGDCSHPNGSTVSARSCDLENVAYNSCLLATTLGCQVCFLSLPRCRITWATWWWRAPGLFSQFPRVEVRKTYVEMVTKPPSNHYHQR
ncbi:hypothetical protein PROFUN_16231 [Planoprotostelium fungivorum]|uniref:Uncharacterized protein n=1 Tax=Planoprotostelium fungivorum TaxID=1890364 RepID=A0A2P6MPP3_9EUKA|nr:hypothetical protein PROFUN_16231 [Planoprotostelium fungivorum]